MKIAIHNASWSYSPDWIEYCKKEKIDYKIVDCYASDIVDQVADCDILMWHHHHSSAKDVLFAKELLYALEQSGKKVFPDFNTGWHFDDKLGQKYLLEAINAPIALSYAFYSKNEALKWLTQTSYPKVFKLRGGAGSSNVKLIKNYKEGVKMVNQAFGSGFDSYNRWGNLKEVIRKKRTGTGDLRNVLKSVRRIFTSTEFARIYGKEKGYVLFQEFIPDNKFDIRVITIGDKAFAIKRLVRGDDFRASGSGFLVYDKIEIDERCIKIAFQTTEKLNAQCVAYDFVFKDDEPLIVEINYGFAHKAYEPCPGYWDRALNWHEGKFNPAYWMVDYVISDNKN